MTRVKMCCTFCLLLVVLILCISVGYTNQLDCSADSENCRNDDGEGLASYIAQQSQAMWGEYLLNINTSLATHSDCLDCHSLAMNSDLSVWTERGGVKQEEFDRAMSGGVHYQIINHQLYRSKDCMFRTRCSGVEYFLLDVAQELPDMELVINVYDYPKSHKHKSPLPIFSFSKTADYYDILYPAWSFWSGGPSIVTEPRGLGRWDEKRQSITQSASKWPWESKRPLGFFRGSRTSGERDPLVLFSRKNPDLVDAQYTKNQAWKSEKDTLGYPPAEVVSLEEHCQYKYLFNFRGVAASFRFRHLFLCGSLVLHVGEEWVEFFYHGLKPWVHYVPVKQDLSDLRDVLMFLHDNDAIAQQIALRGYNYIWSHLRMEDVHYYWKELLIQYAELTLWTIKLDTGMILIQG